jgi:formate transporter
MGHHGALRVTRMSAPQILILAAMAGAFITAGALFSLLLASQVEPAGPKRLLEGLAFSSGFFFVILSSAILFTEANVTLPSTVLACGSPARRIVRFWALAWIGNLIGALTVGGLIVLAHDFGGDVTALLDELIEAKLSFREQGGVGAWGKLIVSGMLANWLVGMAAFFATMGQTILGKYVPVFLAVTLFVSANFQHSPANMGYFSIAEWMGSGPGWDVALWWSIIPAGIGNLIGGTVFVALPFWYALNLKAQRDGPAPEPDQIAD